MKRKSTQKSRVSPPVSALERFKPLLMPQELALLIAELERPLAPSLRVNPLKARPERIQEWALRYGWELKPVPYCSTGWWVPSAQTILSQTIEHRLGYYYIQDAASMLPVELFDWDGLDNPLVLDMAASPGGKTTHLLAKMGDRGLVLANDSSADRIIALRLVLQNWGGLHAAVTNFHGEKFGRWYPNTFDRVLVDAPCSMQGLRSNMAHPMRALSDKERTGLAHRQLNLLKSAILAARPGGQVVYSTCTLEPEEDEGVIDGLVKSFGGVVRVDDVNAGLTTPAPGLTKAYGQTFTPEVSHTARLWPHGYGTAGFFAARLTKLEATPDDGQAAPGRPLAQAGWFPLARKEAAGLILFYQDTYGVSLEHLLEEHSLALWRRGNGVYAFPEAFFERFSELPVQGLGLLMGEDTPDGFNLSHEWVARFGESFTNGRYLLTGDLAPAWLRGEDLLGADPRGLPLGLVAAVFDENGRLLGCGKRQAGRLKNLLPKRLRQG